MTDHKLEVVTAVGKDRPGLVSALSKLIHEAGANVEDSRMAVLGGEFALVMLFSGSADAVAKARESAEASQGDLGLTLFFKETARAAAKAMGDSRAYRLQVSGLDHPGIVHNITGLIAKFEANVDSLETQVVHAPMAGTPTFVLRASLRVPANVPIATLRDALCEQCDEENLDLLFEADI